jgi:H+/Cl- antiporter ClcA
MTGGAFGSMAAQFFHLTSSERKTLLVAGAAGGMSATFAAPIAAAMFAAELLLFEWKPRSLIPVALASTTAAVLRRYLLGPGPLFPSRFHPGTISPEGLLFCVVAGVLAGVLSAILTNLVYWSEDGFKKLPIHWMWWPALGGLLIGVGGLIFPQALGVGYETIGSLLQGDVPMYGIVGILVVKSAIWALALGSGTSGGVLAPLLMIGGALGGVESMIFPVESLGFWPLVSMAATLGGAMRVPFTAVIFAVELTQQYTALLPLFIAVITAYAFSVLAMKRSILTEKISRRGFHLSREYAIDPLEILFVREVMQKVSESRAASLAKVMKKDVVAAFPDEPLRVVVYRMAATARTRLPVVDRDDPSKVLGLVSLSDLMLARTRNLEEEHRRERVLRFRLPFGFEQTHASRSMAAKSEVLK